MADKKMPRYPQQHEPWRPRTCGLYSGEQAPTRKISERVSALKTNRIIFRLLASARTGK